MNLTSPSISTLAVTNDAMPKLKYATKVNQSLVSGIIPHIRRVKQR